MKTVLKVFLMAYEHFSRIYVLSEPLTLMSGIGVLLILAAVVILNVSNGNSRRGR